jgi:hypothetical protein
MLTAEKAPFLLTILFAVCGWTITHTVDRLTTSPVIEYEMSVHQVHNQYQYSIAISNITLSQTFRNIKFTLIPEERGNILDAHLKQVEPLNVTDEPIRTNTSYEVAVEEMHPGMQFIVELLTKNERGIHIHFTCRNNSIKLMEASTQTYLVKHEIGILSVLIFVWIIAIVGYAGLYSRLSKRSTLKSMLLCVLTFLIPCGLASAETWDIRVVDKLGQPVESELYLVIKENDLQRLGRTNAEGFLIISLRGQQGQEVEVRPISQTFFKVRRECPLSEHLIDVPAKEYKRLRELTHLVGGGSSSFQVLFQETRDPTASNSNFSQ